jgi:hypothetical protein
VLTVEAQVHPAIELGVVALLAIFAIARLAGVSRGALEGASLDLDGELLGEPNEVGAGLRTGIL